VLPLQSLLNPTGVHVTARAAAEQRSVVDTWADNDASLLQLRLAAAGQDSTGAAVS